MVKKVKIKVKMPKIKASMLRGRASIKKRMNKMN